MGAHLINGEFQSDKYPWSPPGFVPLKLTDPMAQPLLWRYAHERLSVDEEFGKDLIEALVRKGFTVQEGDAPLAEFKAGWDAMVKWFNVWFCLDLPEADLGNIAMLKEAVERPLTLPPTATGRP